MTTIRVENTTWLENKNQLSFGHQLMAETKRKALVNLAVKDHKKQLSNSYALLIEINI